jgi:hypothetical protein
MKSFPVQTFFFCHCIVCPSSIHGFGLPFCYLQTFIKHVIYRSNVLFAQRSISLHYIWSIINNNFFVSACQTKLNHNGYPIYRIDCQSLCISNNTCAVSSLHILKILSHQYLRIAISINNNSATIFLFRLQTDLLSN